MIGDGLAIFDVLFDMLIDLIFGRRKRKEPPQRVTRTEEVPPTEVVNMTAFTRQRPPTSQDIEVLTDAGKVRFRLSDE